MIFDLLWSFLSQENIDKIMITVIGTSSFSKSLCYTGTCMGTGTTMKHLFDFLPNLTYYKTAKGGGAIYMPLDGNSD